MPNGTINILCRVRADKLTCSVRAYWMALLTERLLSSVPGRRKTAKLVHHAEPIRVVPLFYNPAVDNTIDIYIGNGCFLLRGREAPERALGFEPNSLAVYYQVAFRNQEIRLVCGVDIEAPPQANIHLFDFIAAADRLGITREMAHIVRGEQFIDDVPVSFVPLLEPEDDELLILVSGQGSLLPSLKLKSDRGLLRRQSTIGACTLPE